MKKWIYLILLIISAITLTACSGSKNQEPKYLGMSIISQQSLLQSKDDSFNLNSVNHRLTSSTGEVIIDEEPLENDIEELVTIEVLTDDEVKYYVSQGEKFIVRIHLSNPDNYLVQSFTLNGKIYANYMFEQGSTLELLLLEVTAPFSSGYIDYTIDAIKYIDGTEIKDAIMDGSKTIKAGIRYDNEPLYVGRLENISTTSISLDFDIIDIHQLTRNQELAIYLSDGKQVIEKKDLMIGNNKITFNNLEMGKTYEYGVVGVYDVVDGRELQAHWLYTQTFVTEKAFTFNNYQSKQTSISFNIEKLGSVGNIKHFNLIDEATNQVIRKIEDTNIREMTNLFSNRSYIVELVFDYEVNQQLMTDSVKLKISTLAKTEPTVSIVDVTSTQTSIHFDVEVTDPDSIYTLTKVELYKGETLVTSLSNVTLREFNELLSNNAYTIKVTYTYDLNDGVGLHTKSITSNITTLAKTEPVITLDDLSITDSSILGQILVSDPDNLNTITKVEIYQGNALIDINESRELEFSNLNFYTNYTIKIHHTYNLNDGIGLISKITEFAVTTAPYFRFSDVRVLNTTAVSGGETIILQANIDNPTNASYSKVIVNGKEYNVSPASTQNRLRVEIVNDGQFAGGSTKLEIEEVFASIGGKTFQIEVPTDSFATVFINGNLTLQSISFVGEDLEPILDYIFPNQKVFVLITLDNPTGYDIDSLIVNGQNVKNNLIKIDNNNYYYEVNLGTGWNSRNLSNITYSNVYIQKEITLVNNNQTQFIYKVISNDIQYIQFAEDLLNMMGNYYYELSNDIDLAGLNWFGNDFSGVLNGNGYAIKNMSNVATYQNQDLYLGLFKNGTGVVYNLEFQDITIIVELNSDISGTIYYGGLFSIFSHVVINNISIDQNSSVSINNLNGRSYIGGLIGHASHGTQTISNSYNSGSIIGNNYAGGLIGHARYTTTTISNSYNSGSITGEYSGGLIGHASHGNQTISNSYNSGSITGNNYAGGLIGDAYDSEGTRTIRNSYNSGSITGEYSGGLIGYARYTTTIISNSYNSGSITGEYSGGLIGYARYTTTIISNSYNSGSISGNNSGGLIGHASHGTQTISNSYNSGSISGNNSGGLIGHASHGTQTISNSYNSGSITGEYSGGLIGYAPNVTQTQTISNSYSIAYFSSLITLEQLSSKTFYLVTLEWDERIWNFDTIDSTNNKYPTLR
jgi:hypothetical protein